MPLLSSETTLGVFELLDRDSWTRLVRGLRNATARGRLEWERRDIRAGEGARALGNLILDSMNRPRVFVGLAQDTRYELSSADSFGRAPFELSVWQLEGAKTKAVDSVRSSLDVSDYSALSLNAALQELFQTVDSTTESSAQIVDRLLRDLDE